MYVQYFILVLYRIMYEYVYMTVCKIIIIFKAFVLYNIDCDAHGENLTYTVYTTRIAQYYKV